MWWCIFRVKRSWLPSSSALHFAGPVSVVIFILERSANAFVPHLTSASQATDDCSPSSRSPYFGENRLEITAYFSMRDTFAPHYTCPEEIFVTNPKIPPYPSRRIPLSHGMAPTWPPTPLLNRFRPHRAFFDCDHNGKCLCCSYTPLKGPHPCLSPNWELGTDF